MKTKYMRTDHIKNLVLSAMIAAIAWLSVFIFRINVQFLTYDIKDAIIAIGGLICGPVWVVPMGVLAAFLEMISLSDTGWYGFIMNAASTIAFAYCVSVIYNHYKTFTSALIGLLMGVVSMTGIMLLMNLVITPRYFAGTNVNDVIKMIPTLLLPFNLTKSVLNASLILFLYKPFIKTMRKAGVIRANKSTSQSGAAFQIKKIKNESIASLIIGVVLFAVSLVVLFWFFRGTISFFK